MATDERVIKKLKTEKPGPFSAQQEGVLADVQTSEKQGIEHSEVDVVVEDVATEEGKTMDEEEEEGEEGYTEKEKAAGEQLLQAIAEGNLVCLSLD